jgi:hypothetical protein
MNTTPRNRRSEAHGLRMTSNSRDHDSSDIGLSFRQSSIVEHVQQTETGTHAETGRMRSCVAEGPKRKLFADFGETMFRKTAGANGVRGRSTASVPRTNNNTNDTTRREWAITNTTSTVSSVLHSISNRNAKQMNESTIKLYQGKKHQEVIGR